MSWEWKWLAQVVQHSLLTVFLCILQLFLTDPMIMSFLAMKPVVGV